MAIEGIPPQLRAAMDFAPLDIDQRGPWSALLAASFGADRARMLDLLDGLHRAGRVLRVASHDPHGRERWGRRRNASLRLDAIALPAPPPNKRSMI